MKVVVTGMGCVTCAGGNTESIWRTVVEGRSGLGPITRFPTDDFSTSLGGEARVNAPERDVVFALAREALRQAAPAIDDPRRAGVALGTTLGPQGYADAFMRGDIATGRTPPRLSLYHSIAGLLADELGVEGPCLTFNAACASSIHVIGYALDRIRSGRADVMIAGGADYLSPFVFSGFHALQALATEAMRPFDARRDGMLIGDGAAILVLEREDRARRRGALISAETRGWGFMQDAHDLTAPDPAAGGMIRTIRQALDDARMEPSDVGYVSAHGTATPLNDVAESRAIREAIGPHVPVSSVKPVFGHCLGASAAVETVVSICALEAQILPPTLNHEHPDLECGLDCVSTQARPHRFHAFLKLAAGFGGQTAHCW